jgi:hypothetical protein
MVNNAFGLFDGGEPPLFDHPLVLPHDADHVNDPVQIPVDVVTDHYTRQA